MARRFEATERRRKKVDRKKSPFVFRKRVCRFCTEKQAPIGYKNVSRLQKFLTDKGKIMPSRISGNCAKHQRQLARAVKKARAISLLPYVTER
ncbi:MAG: 30S ribosomal protein S18 [Candidatus Omnitrophota bacterium]|nr:30S ribosomal protein S18 [Candidatus Omnitrophota bacterium]